MTTFKQWPSIEFPESLRNMGFEDRSFGNDLCACAQLPLPGFTEEAGYPCIRVWVEHEDVSAREVSDAPRYFAHALLDHVSMAPEDLDVYVGEDASELLEEIQEAIAQAKEEAQARASSKEA